MMVLPSWISPVPTIARAWVSGSSGVVKQLKRYRVAKAFLGLDGLSLQRGLSANSEAEAASSLAVAGAAGHVYLLFDASKLVQNKYFQLAPLSLIDTLIMDAPAPEVLRAQYPEAGVAVLGE